MNDLNKSIRITWRNIYQSIPVLLGVIMAISLLKSAIPKSFYSTIFSGNVFIDPLLGSIFGSIAAGNPITSYVVGGDLLYEGVSLFAVTAFLLSWVSVGLFNLPAEMALLGKKFAVARNIIFFVISFFISIITVFTLNFIGV